MDIGTQNDDFEVITKPERETVTNPIEVPAPSVPAPSTTPAEPVKV